MNGNKLIRISMLAVLSALLFACEISIDESERLERAERAIARNDLRTAGIELKNVLRADPSNVTARVLLGRVSYAAGDPATATKEFLRARELGAPSEDYLIPLGRALLAINKPDEVLDLSIEDLRGSSAKADLRSLHGNAHLLKLEFSEARLLFEQTLDQFPDHADALIGMARVYLESGDAGAAETALRRVIAQGSDVHVAHAALARLKLNAADYPEAERSFRRAIEITDNNMNRREQITYLAGLVDALLLQRKSGAAQDTARKMLEIAPDHPYALFQAGRADFEAGRHDEAIEKAQRVITANPEYQPARLLLAAAAMSKENFALAEVHLRSLLGDNPSNELARKLMAQTQLGLGSPGEAFNILEPLLSGDVVDPQILAIAGSAGVSSGQTARGLEYLAQGVKLGGLTDAAKLQTASSFIAAGKAKMAIDLLVQMDYLTEPVSKRDSLLLLARVSNGDIDEARAEAQAILDKYPNNPDSHKLMGNFYLMTEQTGKARSQFETAARLGPDDLSIIVSLARLDVLDGNLQNAEQRYRDMLSHTPNSQFALFGLSQLAEKQGNDKEAVKLLESARRIDPNALQPVLYLAQFYLRLNKLVLAEERANQAVTLAPESAEALGIVGLVQLANDRYSEAVNTFERALELGPNSGDTHFYLAQAQLKLGMNEAARKSVAKTLSLNPQHLRGRMAITRLDNILGNHPEALRMAQELHQDFPDLAEPLVLEGDIQAARGRYNDAITAYDQAAKIVPDESNLAIKRYQVRQIGGHADAYRVLEKWMEDHPADKEMELALAQAYQAANQNSLATELYKKILSTDKNNVVALNNLAWLYAEIGGAENLLLGAEIAERAHKALPDVGQVTDTYGWLLLTQGKVDEATRLLRRAMLQAPEDPEIRYHLAVALQRSGSATEARDLLDGILEGKSGSASKDKARDLRNKL